MKIRDYLISSSGIRDSVRIPSSRIKSQFESSFVFSRRSLNRLGWFQEIPLAETWLGMRQKTQRFSIVFFKYRGRVGGSTLHRGRGLGPKVFAQRRGRVRFLENFSNFRYKLTKPPSRHGRVGFGVKAVAFRRFALNDRRVASRRVERPSRRLASR